MEHRTIEALLKDWSSVIWKVIEFKNVDMAIIQGLLSESYVVLKEYSTDELVPKRLSKLLLEMNDFNWWIGNLEETPLHGLYQTFGDIITKLKIGFFYCDFENETIEKLIDELVK